MSHRSCEKNAYVIGYDKGIRAPNTLTNHEVRGKKIIKEPPFLSYLEYACWEAHLDSFDDIIKQSRVFDRPFLSWERVRLGVTPVGALGTGFEGYVVGECVSEDEAISSLLEMGTAVWASIDRMYPNMYAKKKEIEKVLRGESCNLEALEKLHTLFGALRARAAAKLHTNTQAQAFRNHTKQLVESLPQIAYIVDEQGAVVQQEYTVPSEPVLGRLSTLSGLSAKEELAAVTMMEIGKCGHPLFRAALKVAHS